MNFKGKKVGVFGMGISGVSAAKLLHFLGAELIVGNKDQPKQWKNYATLSSFLKETQCFREEEFTDELAKMELVILGPGISKEHPTLKEVHAKKIPIWSEIELGSCFIDAPILAITGTNGKTSTTTILGHLLKTAGKKVFVGGNIGIPVCDFVLEELKKNKKEKYDCVVLELSSFQLESMVEFRPHVAAILNITFSHGERYVDLKSYATAKWQIIKKMQANDFFLYPEGVAEAEAQLSKLSAKPIPFTTASNLKDMNRFDLSKFKLPGEHNLNNLSIAVRMAQLVGVRDDQIQIGIDSIPVLVHRIELVNSTYPFKIFNDSKSTNIDSTFVALKAVAKMPGPIYLILGGKFRNQATDGLKKYSNELKKYCSKVLLIGETTDFLYDDLKHELNCEKFYTLEKVAATLINQGFQGTLLFSPAFPSFDQFQDYNHRGNYFKSLFTSK